MTDLMTMIKDAAKSGNIGTLHLTIIDAKLTHDTETFGKMDPMVRMTSD